ncbi:MAG: outer membrane lipoprotein carrier protein LolA [Pseudomonadota bacterium]
MKMHRFTALLIAVTFSANAAAPVFDQATNAEQLKLIIAPAARELAKTPVLRGSFVQRKFLSGLPKPLKSSGNYVISREQGIWWHTQLPFDSEFILTPESMAQLDGGKVATRLTAAQQPGLRVVGDVFFSIFALDPSALAANFELFGQRGERDTWTMGLRPKSSAMRSVMSEAVITGASRVDKVEMWDAHGDRTEITLTSKGNATTLTAEEAALFKK